MKRLWYVVLLFAALAGRASAQTNTFPAISGNPTAGDCPVWVSAYTIGDSGSPCGGGGSAWASGTTYGLGTVVAYSGNSYASLVIGNVGNEPDTSPSDWGMLANLSNLPTSFASQSATNPQSGKFSTLSAKNNASIGPRYDVTQYGAVGNGVTDDTAAIQAAFTACYAGGGGTVEFPGAHAYKVSSTIYPYDTCRLQGERGQYVSTNPSLSASLIYWDGPNTESNTASVTAVTVVNNRTAGTPLYTAMDPSSRPATQIANYQIQMTGTNNIAANEWVELSGCTNPQFNNVIAQVSSSGLSSSGFTAVYNGTLTTGTYSETCTATQATVIFAFDSVEHEVDTISDLEFGDHITGGGTNTPEGVDVYFSGRIDSGNNLYRTWFESPHYFGAYYADGGEDGKIEEGSRGDASDYYQVYWRMGGTDHLTIENSQFGPTATSTSGASTGGGAFLIDNAPCGSGSHMNLNFDHVVMENDVDMTPGLALITLLDCPTSTLIPQFQLTIHASDFAGPSNVTGLTMMQVLPASNRVAAISITDSQMANNVNTTNIIVGVPAISLYGQFGNAGFFSDFHYYPSIQSWGLGAGAYAQYIQPAQFIGDTFLQNLFQFNVPGSLWLNSDTAYAALPSGTTLAQGMVLAPPAYFDCGTGSGCGRYAVDVVQSAGTTGTLNGGSTTCTNATSGQATVTCTSATGLMTGQYVTTPTGSTRIAIVNAANPSAVLVTLDNNQTVYTNQPISYTAPVLGKEVQLITKASAIPTAGTWSEGDVLQNSAATAGGTCSWVNTVAGTPGTWIVIPCNAAYQISYQPGPLTAVSATISGFDKISQASTVVNLTGSAMSFTCSANPTVTLYECGTSSTCGSPTTIGTVTVTGAGTAVAGTISSSTINAGDYIAWAITSGTCTALNISVTSQVYSN